MDFPASDAKRVPPDSEAFYIPLPSTNSSSRSRRSLTSHIIGGIFLVAIVLAAAFSRAKSKAPAQLEPFYAHVSRPEGFCTGVDGRTLSSFAGHIGLKGDTEDQPKRSFFWFFQAEHDSDNAPIILTIGGGPGSSGLLNPMFGQSHCIMTENGTVANPNRWTERYNLLAIDHPIGVGFSYGTHVNNSRDAAYDVYDFLQKFFRLYPHLAKSTFALSGGSYGGVYVPNIATVIHEQNLLLAQGRGQHGAVHINLEALIISNPMSDPISHFRWLLQYRCVETNLYNSTTCTELYAVLPECLEAIQLAYDYPSRENHKKAFALCFKMEAGDTHGTLVEDTRRKCNMTNDVASCFPVFDHMKKYFNDPATKAALGVPAHLNYTPLNMDVNKEFEDFGDIFHPHYLLYEPLLKAGIRVLHYVGARDANCAWPGVLSFLKLLRTPFQEEFIHAPDVPWPAKENATVRVVGDGAGSMTFIKVAEAGHFTVYDQPALAKMIVEHWLENQPFIPSMES
ncbi:alpha/beta-hydrolase [Artomyces pyxidatus]|uniref:Alpha/beta-hydrolase n=1 Tax=Artomyces pyxidatus TaxID=48021 RepID=A0ACB8T285_9AGAM|nr:alpha/beta-hydrolase [Artomyces pyxidatus]